MISGQVTRVLTELDSSSTREYGWHFICSNMNQPGSEGGHINTTISHYYDLTAKDQKAGIYDIIYREFLIDFLLPPKMSSQQVHIVAFRAKRGHDSVIGKTLESVKSVSISQILSVGSVHKIFFLLLLFMYFANRMICGRYESLKEENPEVASDTSSVVFEDEMGYMEKACRHKDQTIVLVAVIFIILSVLKQLLKKISDRRKIAQMVRNQNAE